MSAQWYMYSDVMSLQNTKTQKIKQPKIPTLQNSQTQHSKTPKFQDSKYPKLN